MFRTSSAHHQEIELPVSRVLQFPPDRQTKQSLTQTNHTRWCINNIRSPDDEHLMLETRTEMK